MTHAFTNTGMLACTQTHTWASEMAALVKAMAGKLDDKGSSPTPIGQKERMDSHRLSSDMCKHLKQEAHYQCVDFSHFISILAPIPTLLTVDVKIFKLAISTVNTASRGTGTPCAP